MGPKEPKNDIQYHLHKTYWGLPRKFFEKHWGLHFSLWGLQLKILVRNSIRDSIFWGLHSKYFGDSTWDSIGDSHWGLQWSPKWSPPKKKTTRDPPAKIFLTLHFEKLMCHRPAKPPRNVFLLSSLKNECVIDPRNPRENPAKCFFEKMIVSQTREPPRKFFCFAL